jgi:hypothetical protein
VSKKAIANTQGYAVAILNCKVTKTGLVPITIHDVSGDVLFSTTMTITMTVPQVNPSPVANWQSSFLTDQAVMST